ncbi:MAG: hypothetical protein JWP31_298 [Aeromicrobium sp.]|nr:hypothetical protein [Aeromicrobium sp.]
MSDEQPARRVVKKVVKKTVVRPSAPPEAPAPVRYGRPVATARKPQAKAAARPAGSPVGKTASPKPATAPRQRPSLDVRGTAGAAGHRVGEAWWAVADRARSGAGTARSFATTHARTVAAWRLPHINPFLAAVVSGAVTGIVAVALGLFALSIFSDIRGVASGGGLWGGLTFVLVAVLGIGVGELLLRGFGLGAARLTAFLGVVLTIVAMLGLFLDVVETRAALLLVPALGALAFAAAHWLVDLAENSPPVLD